VQGRAKTRITIIAGLKFILLVLVVTSFNCSEQKLPASQGTAVSGGIFFLDSLQVRTLRFFLKTTDSTSW